MAAALARLLSCRTESLPYNLMLMAKALSVVLIVSGELLVWRLPFLPFVPGLEWLPSGAALRAVQWIGFLALVAVLFRIAPRAACACAGLCALATLLWNRAGYESNIMFYSLLLILLGLQEQGRTVLVRWQLVIVYFGAMLDKVLNADWRSGQFFDYWMGSMVKHRGYTIIASALPPLVAGKLFSWTTIVIEALLAAGFAIRRLWRYAIVLAIAFHLAMTAMTGDNFGMFFMAVLCSLLAFVEWPASTMLAIYDGDCGLCERTRKLVEKLDPDRLIQWKPYQSGAGHQYGISDDDAMQRVYLVRDGAIYGAYPAVRQILAHLPATYLTIAGLIAVILPQVWHPSVFTIAAAILLCSVLGLLIAPTALGNAGYYLVARNRYALGGTCPR